MNPGFWLICPPRAADGPIGPKVWARLAARLLLLAILFSTATILAQR